MTPASLRELQEADWPQVREIVGTVAEAFLLPSGAYADLHVMHLALRAPR